MTAIDARPRSRPASSAGGGRCRGSPTSGSRWPTGPGARPAGSWSRACSSRRSPTRRSTPSATPSPRHRRRAAVAVTTDGFVVTPIWFPGGSIGELAVNGTVNDLAVSGARPVAVTAASSSRRASPADVVRREAEAMAAAAEGAGVPHRRRRHQGRRARQGRPALHHDDRASGSSDDAAARRRIASGRATWSSCPDRSAITA